MKVSSRNDGRIVVGHDKQQFQSATWNSCRDVVMINYSSSQQHGCRAVMWPVGHSLGVVHYET